MNDGLIPSTTFPFILSPSFAWWGRHLPGLSKDLCWFLSQVKLFPECMWWLQVLLYVWLVHTCTLSLIHIHTTYQSMPLSSLYIRDKHKLIAKTEAKQVSTAQWARDTTSNHVTAFCASWTFSGNFANYKSFFFYIWSWRYPLQRERDTTTLRTKDPTHYTHSTTK